MEQDSTFPLPIKTTEYFHLTEAELKKKNNDGYSKEVAKIYDLGNVIEFYQDVQQFEKDPFHFKSYVEEAGCSYVASLEMVDGRIVVICK